MVYNINTSHVYLKQRNLLVKDYITEKGNVNMLLAVLITSHVVICIAFIRLTKEVLMQFNHTSPSFKRAGRCRQVFSVEQVQDNLQPPHNIAVFCALSSSCLTFYRLNLIRVLPKQPHQRFYS